MWPESIKKSRSSTSRLKEAVEFLGIDPDDEAVIVSPAEYGLYAGTLGFFEVGVWGAVE
jgi:hypothetical protein